MPAALLKLRRHARWQWSQHALVSGMVILLTKRWIRNSWVTTSSVFVPWLVYHYGVICRLLLLSTSTPRPHDDVMAWKASWFWEWKADSPYTEQAMRAFDVFVDVSLVMLLNKQSSCRWIEMPWCSLVFTVLHYDYPCASEAILNDKVKQIMQIHCKLII